MDNKYVKVVYQSDPIGKEGIILYLTTFDVEKYDEDQKAKLKKQEQIYARTFEKEDLLNPYFLEQLEKEINNAVIKLYGEQLKKLENIYNSQQIIYSSEPKWIDINAKNITNSDDVHCNIVYGNITNCDNIYCNEIKGNVVNCDKIIYKK